MYFGLLLSLFVNKLSIIVYLLFNSIKSGLGVDFPVLTNHGVVSPSPTDLTGAGAGALPVSGLGAEAMDVEN
mgnify:CR=1 FL=1